MNNRDTSEALESTGRSEGSRKSKDRKEEVTRRSPLTTTTTTIYATSQIHFSSGYRFLFYSFQKNRFPSCLSRPRPPRNSSWGRHSDFKSGFTLTYPLNLLHWILPPRMQTCLAIQLMLLSKQVSATTNQSSLSFTPVCFPLVRDDLPSLFPSSPSRSEGVSWCTSKWSLQRQRESHHVKPNRKKRVADSGVLKIFSP